MAPLAENFIRGPGLFMGGTEKLGYTVVMKKNNRCR